MIEVHGLGVFKIKKIPHLHVRKRVAVILREHLPDDFLPPPPIPTSLPLSESDQGNLVENLPS